MIMAWGSRRGSIMVAVVDDELFANPTDRVPLRTLRSTVVRCARIRLVGICRHHGVPSSRAQWRPPKRKRDDASTMMMMRTNPTANGACTIAAIVDSCRFLPHHLVANLSSPTSISIFPRQCFSRLLSAYRLAFHDNS